MRNEMRRVVCLILVSLAAAGCSKAKSGGGEDPNSRLKALMAIIGQATSRLGHPPKTEKELRDYIASEGTATLESFKVASADELLVSPRDNQLYVIVYGKPDPKMAPGVIVYEQTGQDGVRKVGFNLGYVEEANETRFRELVPNPGTP